MATASFYTGRGPVLVAVIWTWAGIATILYVLRAIKASVAPKAHNSFFGVRWDFIWVTVAYVNAICANAFITVSVLYGTGNHQDDLSNHQAVYSALWSWIGQVCAIFSMVWGRFGVIALLVALQGPTYQTWRYALYVVGVAQALINIIEVVLILNQCSPTQKLWDQSIPGTCNLIGLCSKVGFLQGSIGAFADFFLALYPPAVIIGPLQQMKISIKIGLCMVMGGGVVAGVAGIVKTILIESITHTGDISYVTVNLLIWVLTEVWFIIIFGSIPAIRAFLYSVGRNIKTITHVSGGRTKGSQYSHSHNPDWVELSGPPYRSTLATIQAQNGERKYGSEERILAPRLEDKIMVTKELTVTRGTDETSPDSHFRV